jgi:hypothetical protein
MRGFQKSIIPFGPVHGHHAIVTSVERDRRYAYRWMRRQSAFSALDLRIAVRESKTMPVGMDYHSNEIRVVE